MAAQANENIVEIEVDERHLSWDIEVHPPSFTIMTNDPVLRPELVNWCTASIGYAPKLIRRRLVQERGPFALMKIVCWAQMRNDTDAALLILRLS